jgi:hypothetical protein
MFVALISAKGTKKPAGNFGYEKSFHSFAPVYGSKCKSAHTR